jgi:hypothetical protein
MICGLCRLSVAECAVTQRVFVVSSQETLPTSHRARLIGGEQVPCLGGCLEAHLQQASAIRFREGTIVAPLPTTRVLSQVREEGDSICMLSATHLGWNQSND